MTFVTSIVIFKCLFSLSNKKLAFPVNTSPCIMIVHVFLPRDTATRLCTCTQAEKRDIDINRGQDQEWSVLCNQAPITIEGGQSSRWTLAGTTLFQAIRLLARFYYTFFSPRSMVASKRLLTSAQSLSTTCRSTCKVSNYANGTSLIDFVNLSRSEWRVHRPLVGRFVVMKWLPAFDPGFVDEYRVREAWLGFFPELPVRLLYRISWLAAEIKGIFRNCSIFFVSRANNFLENRNLPVLYFFFSLSLDIKNTRQTVSKRISSSAGWRRKHRKRDRRRFRFEIQSNPRRIFPKLKRFQSTSRYFQLKPSRTHARLSRLFFEGWSRGRWVLVVQKPRRGFRAENTESADRRNHSQRTGATK